ncbi:MAG TPA: pYEATS domain-containing protein [Gemmatimonadales bacterium]|nr:pYEATS domain-containing protein [Gemmatimonadales bacterium]
MSARFDWLPHTRWCLTALVMAAALTVPSPAMAQALSATNISRYMGDGRWDWTIYLVGAPEVLRDVRCVEYRLHPTFPNPVQKICSIGDPTRPFALHSNGWGTFEVGLTVTLRSGEVRQFQHMLSFETPTIERPLSLTAANRAKEVRDGWWAWTVFIRGPEEALRHVRCVEYKLHPTFPDRVRTVCDRGRGSEAFPLSSSGWGTFTVQIRVILDNGRVQELAHELEFPRAGR